MPAATASSTTYWIAGLSTTGSISFGIALVAGRKRVPSPAAGITALIEGRVMQRPYRRCVNGMFRDSDIEFCLETAPDLG